MLTPGRSNKIIKKTVSKPISEEPKNEGRVNTITKGTISVPNGKYVNDASEKAKPMIPVSKAKQMASNIASKLKRG